jgi:hypothetical protein
MKRYFIIACLALASCTTTQVKPVAEPPVAIPVDDGKETSIDFESIKRHLHMERERDSLGFSEKSFNTCETGFGYSRSQNCRQQNLTVINFRLLCRDSEGTISTVLTEADLRPLERRSVRWNLKGSQGVTNTDSDGYGQITMASGMSQKNQRVKLAIGNEFLYMKAGELQRVITPRPWCSQY